MGEVSRWYLLVMLYSIHLQCKDKHITVGLIRILIFKGFLYTVFSVLSSVATTPDALGLPHDPHLTTWIVFVLVLTFDLLAAPIRNTVTHWNKVITVCLNSDRSESNDTPTTTPATLTLHRGLLSHAAVWLQWSTHATTGDEQKQAKGTAEHREELVLPTDHNNHYTRTNIHIQTLCKWCSCQFHHTGLKICKHSVSAASWPKKYPTWFDFPLLLWHGEHSRYCALATCAKQTLVNGGQVSSRQWIPQCAHIVWIPLEAHFCQGKENNLQLTDPHNVQCTMWSCKDNYYLSTFSN